MSRQKSNGNSGNMTSTSSTVTALVPASQPEPTALAVKDPYEMDDEDEYEALRPSMSRQKFDGKGGDFEHSLSQEKTKSLTLVVLSMRYSNVCFTPIGEPGPSWVCRSNDSFTGILNTELTEKEINTLRIDGHTGNCSTCAKAKWGGADGKQKPICSHGLNLLCINREDDSPFVLNASRTSLRPWENILNGLRQLRKRPYSHEITVTGEFHEKNGLKWYSMSPKLGKLLTPEEVAAYHSRRQALLKPFGEEATEPDAPAAAPASVPAGASDTYEIEELPF